jgi:hypothetical protein
VLARAGSRCSLKRLEKGALPMHRSPLRLAAMAAVVACGALALAPSAFGTPTHAPNHKVSHSTSTDWSGYAVTGSTYMSVSANWTQP